MSDEGNNPLSMEAAGDSPPKSSKMGMIKTIAAVIGLLIAIVIGALSLLSVAELEQKTARGFSGLSKSVDERLNSVTATPELSGEQLNGIARTVYDKLGQDTNTQVASQVAEYLQKNHESIVGQAIEQIGDNLPTASSPSIDEGAVEDIVNRVFDERSARLSRMVAGMQTELNEQERARRRLATHVQDIEKQLEELKNTPVQTASAAVAPRKRLKEFNLIEVLKNGKLFVVDAPRRNGKVNSITLTVGEPFLSKFGRHKVTGIEQVKGKPRLIVSGGWFIDEIREELTKGELQKVQNNKPTPKPKKNASQVTKKKVTEKKPKPVAKQKPKSTEKVRLAKVASDKLFLKGWKVITPIKEHNRVVVFNPNTSQAQQLKMNDYVAGIGTVRSIDFASGETCFEKYCIAGHNF